MSENKIPYKILVRPLYLIVFVILMFQLMKLVVLLKRLVLTKLD